MSQWVRPEPLLPGQTIGVVAPSSSIAGLGDQVTAGLSALAAHGYRVRLGRHLHDEWMGLAGTREARAEDFNAMLRDPDVRMVMATHGGFGCLPLLDAIDYGALEADPKWVSGISDLTILLNALTAQTRVMTLHGPDVAFAFGLSDPRELQWFGRLTGSPEAGVCCPHGGDTSGSFGRERERDGSGEGTYRRSDTSLPPRGRLTFMTPSWCWRGIRSTLRPCTAGCMC